ncbi:MAG: ATP-dependent RNA helicase HrpA [Neisseriaceae bacterium]|nr:MAG: ATP-dependent RNA helicase HrpA [Neisseriaceae bacterium]
MDLNQVLSKDIFFLQQAQKDPNKFGGLKNIQQKYQKSHQAYLNRLQKKPTVHFDENLPIIEKHDEIKKAIQNNQVVIICGETGSGKTTQIPKICLELDRGIAGMIGHTQPRRIAARAIATKIAEEFKSEVSKEVGYKVRFQDKTSEDTYIKLITDGMLLSEIQSSRYLQAYDTIIIDEAHERSLNIDFLLGYLKKIIKKRKDLKIIITSATINADMFSKHFDQAPIIHVSGRTYPIEVRYRPLQSEDENEANISLPEAILQAINELWAIEKGDILVFLPGEREIRESADFLRKSHLNKMEILPLFSRLSNNDQQKIFHPKQSDRRIILSTNIAETSLTVPGIKYVIDSGQARVKRYAPRAKVEQLNIEKISQAAAKQRMGRCGRTSKGICIRLYSEEDYLNRNEFTDPEILRSNLAHVILMISYLRLGNINSFPLIDLPDSRLINNGIQLLNQLGAMNQKEELTSLGREMAKIPLDPQFSRILLAAKQHDCVYEILIIVSALSIQDPRERPFEAKEAAKQAHEKFSHPNSDFLSFIYLWNFFQTYQQQYSNRQLLQLCKENFLSYLRMKEWKDLFKQLKQIIQEMGFRIKENREIAIDGISKKQKVPLNFISYEQIHCALLSGLLTNIGMKSIDSNDYINVRGNHFYIFPTSYLYKKKPKWIMASELIETSKLYARNVAMIEPEWVEKEANHLIKYHYFEPRWSNKRGEVVANQKVSLYGLTIIPSRIVSFSKIDSNLAREIFIKDGLTSSNLDLKDSFYINNQTVLNEVEELENKERKQNLLLEDVLFDFYNQRLPKNIVDLTSLKNWLNKDKDSHNSVLSFELSDLIIHTKQLDTEEQFPKYLIIDNTRLSLIYRFELNHPMDGVTLQLPLAFLNKINAKHLEWLVPGMIREKLQLLIKALPKNLRKICVPIPEFITNFLMTNPDDSQAIIPQLAKAIGKKAGNINLFTQTILENWQKYQLPDYCYMNIQVIDENNKELAMGRDLLTLQKRLGIQAQNAFRDYNNNQYLDQQNITHWNIGSIPSQIKFSRDDGQLLIGYLGLNIQDNGRISLTVFDTKEAAEEAHQQGVIALMKLQLKEQVKNLNKNIPDFNQIILLFRGLYLSEVLKKEIIDTICERAFIGDDELPKDEKSFNQQLRIAKQRLPEIKIAIHEYLLNVANAYNELKQKQGKHVLTKKIEEQLSRIIYPGFIINTPWNIWPRLPVYLKAIQLRLDKYSNNPARDKDNQLQIEQLEERFYELFTKTKQEKHFISRELVQYRWKIEELRVSLFAQELKIPYPVSLKRLEKEWQKLTQII